MFLLCFCALAQDPSPATLRGTLRDSNGKPVAEATILVETKNSADISNTHSDAQGSYVLAKLPDGVYSVRAAKAGYVDAQVSSVFLRAGENKTVDLTLTMQAGPGTNNSAPEFFDQPQFTVAGVTDTTALGGHGSDTVVRARDSLAKDTASLAKNAVAPAIDAAREKSLRELAERQPRDFTANHEFGQLLLATGRAREAIPFLQRAASQDPSNYGNAYDLALANAQAGNYAIARAEAQKLLATNDKADVHHLLADVDEKLGDSLEAVRHYERASELDSTEPHLFDWGAELLLHHAPEPAIEVFSKGTRLFPASVRILLGLGAAQFARGAYDEAIQEVCRASELNPADPIPYIFLGRIEQAGIAPSSELLEKLHRFLTLQPRNADANYFYALGLWKLRSAAREKTSIAEIESLLKAAVQIDPRHAATQFQLGIVHSDQGAYAQAISDYRKALEANPQMEEAHYRLAQAYRQIGDSEKAKEETRLYGQLAKESSQKQDRERHEIKQFVYTLRDQPSPQVH